MSNLILENSKLVPVLDHIITDLRAEVQTLTSENETLHKQCQNMAVSTENAEAAAYTMAKEVARLRAILQQMPAQARCTARMYCAACQEIEPLNGLGYCERCWQGLIDG